MQGFQGLDGEVSVSLDLSSLLRRENRKVGRGYLLCSELLLEEV